MYLKRPFAERRNPTNMPLYHILETIILPPLDAPTRLSDALVGAFVAIPTRKGIKKAIGRGEVRVNGATGQTADWLHGGERIELLRRDVPVEQVLEMALDVPYEDDYLAVVVKPAGIAVSGNQWLTLARALPHNLDASTQPDALAAPQPVHRLDAPTSGLLLVAKAHEARVRLGEMMASHRIEKVYHAVVMGDVGEESLRLDADVEGKRAVSHVSRVARARSLRNGWLSLVRVTIETGRTHQIRRHLSGAGWPILGDKLYGREGEVMRGKGLFLAATALALAHPMTGEPLVLDLDVPSKFRKTLAREAQMWERYHQDSPKGH